MTDPGSWGMLSGLIPPPGIFLPLLEHLPDRKPTPLLFRAGCQPAPRAGRGQDGTAGGDPGAAAATPPEGCSPLPPPPRVDPKSQPRVGRSEPPPPQSSVPAFPSPAPVVPVARLGLQPGWPVQTPSRAQLFDYSILVPAKFWILETCLSSPVPTTWPPH